MNTIKITKDGRPATRAELCAAAGIPQHTPGPWNVGPKSPDGSIPIIADITRAIGEVKNPFSRDDKGQSEANARLIAAAPDLLAACRHALEAITDPENIDEQDAVDALELAIAKYTGK